jgi:hypothetical protein
VRQPLLSWQGCRERCCGLGAGLVAALPNALAAAIRPLLGWVGFRGLEPLEPASSCCLAGCRPEETEDPPVVGLSPTASSAVEEDVGR